MFDGQAIALRLGNLLAVFVEEQLVDQAFRAAAAEHLGNAAGLQVAVSEVLAAHLVIDAEGDPAHPPVNLPLQLGMAAEDRGLDILAKVMEPDDPGLRIDHRHRHLQHLPGCRRDRENRRIGLAPLLAQGGQHDVHDRAEIAQHAAQGIIECPGIVAIGGRDKFVLEPEAVEEFAQHRVVVMREAFVLVERIGDAAQRMADVRGEQPLVGQVFRHLAQPVHVVGKGDQPGRRAA